MSFDTNKFQTIKVDLPSLESITPKSIDLGRGLVAQSGGRVKSNPSTDPTNKINSGQTELSTFEPVKISNKYYFRMRFYDYKKPLRVDGEDTQETTKGFEQAKYEVKLPLPLSLYDQANIAYDTPALALLGDMGELLEGFAGAAGGGVEGLKSFLLEQTKTIAPAAVNRLFYDIAPNFLNALTGPLGIGNVAATLQQQFGATVNPNEALTLQGVPLRSWSFRWLFIPHDEEESIQVQQLVRQLKARSLPFVARSSDGATNPTGLLGYPQICLINMYPWDSGTSYNKFFEWTDQSIVKIKRTMITGVNVQYNSQGTPAFFRGTNNPVSIDLTISFKEIEYFLAEDEAAPGYTIRSVDTPANNIYEGITDILNPPPGT